MLTSMGDALGRAYRPGQQYEMDDKRAAGLIEAGHAKAVESGAVVAVNLLKARGGGLVVTGRTDPALVAAAKAARLRVHRLRERAANGKRSA